MVAGVSENGLLHQSSTGVCDTLLEFFFVDALRFHESEFHLPSSGISHGV
jgi:hypothetical protein